MDYVRAKLFDVPEERHMRLNYTMTIQMTKMPPSVTTIKKGVLHHTTSKFVHQNTLTEPYVSCVICWFPIWNFMLQLFLNLNA